MTPSPLWSNLLSLAGPIASRPALVAWIMKNFSFALPVERLHETKTLLAFHHPQPSYAVHILLVPKKPLANLMDLDPEIDQDFLIDLYATVKKLVMQLKLDTGGFRLVVNGGNYQDFPFLHYHLIADSTPTVKTT
jgi:histidine triad (HIT) family protein